MAKRIAIPQRHSKRLFRATAGARRVHPKNRIAPRPMRGGIRL